MRKDTYLCVGLVSNGGIDTLAVVLAESEVEKLERHILEIAPTTRLELLTKIYFICQSRIVAAEDRKAMQLACKIILKYVDSLLSTRPQVSDNAT